MSKKTKKILNGDYDIFPKNAEKFPDEFLRTGTTFTDRWSQIIRESYKADKKEISHPVPGIVLKVVKGGKLTPGGPRSKINMISDANSQTCLKMWVHTSFDDALSVPRNFINPGDEEDLIYEHFIFEAQNEELDKIIPEAGDIVQVIHPWAWGFTNKVGLYVGKLATGTAPTFEPTSNKFKNKNKRNKNVPES